MNRLGEILRALFWLPILVAGFTGLTFVAPNFREYRLPGIFLLMLFVVLGLVQTIFDRRQNAADIEGSEKEVAVTVSQHPVQKRQEPTADSEESI